MEFSSTRPETLAIEELEVLDAPSWGELAAGGAGALFGVGVAYLILT